VLSKINFFDNTMKFDLIKEKKALRSWNPMKSNKEIQKCLGYNNVTQTPASYKEIETMKKSLDDLIAEKNYTKFVETIEKIHMYIDPKLWMELQHLFLYNNDEFDHAKSILKLLYRKVKSYAMIHECVPKTFSEIPSKIILKSTFDQQFFTYLRFLYFWMKNCHEKLQVKRQDHTYRRECMIWLAVWQAFSILLQIVLMFQTSFDAEFWLNMNYQNICFNSVFGFGLMIYQRLCLLNFLY